MIKVSDDQKAILTPLFDGIHDSLIISCIQNYFGSAWVDDIVKPASGMILSGDFCFLAGEPSEEFLRSLEENFKGRELVVISDSPQWDVTIEKVFGIRCKKTERHAIKKEGDIFDRELLKKYAQRLPEGYVLRVIDQSVYDRIMSEEWSRDFCRNYSSWEHFRDVGMGVTAYCGEELAAGASSYTSYREGIEIQIITKEEHRRRGLALACAASLILMALEHHLYPNWDAANMTSAAIAQKLGYHYDKPYEAYDVTVK